MTAVGPLLIVYVVWGSTYLGLKVGLEALPPLTLNAVRFLVAGVLLFAYCRYRRWQMPDRRQWRAGAIQGLLLPAAGTGGACWAEQTLPSGTTALFLATIPLWIVLGGRVVDHERITLPVGIGLVAGIAGVAILVRPGGAGHVVATAVALGAALCWGLGSVYALHAPRPEHALVASAAEMLSAGLILAVLATFSGELGRIHVTVRSTLALGYLIVFGSLIAYTAYTWLLDNVAPRIAGTYAFVNPVVAVLLGWWLLGEQLDARILAGTAVIAVAVALIVLAPVARPGAVRRSRATTAVNEGSKRSVKARTSLAETPGRTHSPAGPGTDTASLRPVDRPPAQESARESGSGGRNAPIRTLGPGAWKGRR
jgi:drug/metabolite transporter (DMT)-like permease